MAPPSVYAVHVFGTGRPVRTACLVTMMRATITIHSRLWPLGRPLMVILCLHKISVPKTLQLL